jgi:putative tricarboxylic transport membrane protein
MYIGNMVCLIFGLAIIPFLMKLMKVPKNILAPIITVVCIVGAYADSNSMFDIWVMLIAGVISFLIQKKGIPSTPIILTFVLGPTFELKVRQALELSNCDLTVFIRQPISLFFLLFAACMCMAPVVLNLFKKAKAKKGA